MARSKKQMIGSWLTEDGDRVWVYKSGKSYWLSFRDHEHLCHPSIRSVTDMKREAMLVYHVKTQNFEPIG